MKKENFPKFPNCTDLTDLELEDKALDIIEEFNIDVKVFDCNKHIIEVTINTPYGLYVHRSHPDPNATLNAIIPYKILKEI